MTHGDPVVGRSNSRTGHGGGVRGNVGHGGANGSNGRQTPIMDSDCEGGDSSANTPMSAKMGKMVAVKVLMLDDSITVFQVQVRSVV